jgi:hypothetical protein
VSAYLGRYRGETRSHTESDLRIFMSWCTDQRHDPLATGRTGIDRLMLSPPHQADHPPADGLVAHFPTSLGSSTNQPTRRR